tara:strand:+ start:2658 stop:3275 length:618 start_codon:yes stop_codon:yes gene_type:complete
MTRLFLFSFLILIASASCTISKRQHLSGYHVDLIPALKKGPSKPLTTERETPSRANEKVTIKEIVPLPSLRPGYSSIKEEPINLYHAPQDKVATEVQQPKSKSSVLEGDTDTEAREKKALAAQGKSPKAAPSDLKTHQAFFIAAGILALASALFYALLFNFATAGASYILLFVATAIGFYVGLILFTIALLIGLVLYIVYLSEKE